jgi:hypothetical protein
MLIRYWFKAWLLIALLLHSFASAAAQPQGKWEIHAPMPSARTEVAAVELGGKIYVIGGYEKGGDLMEEYDPAKDSWRRRALLPRPLHQYRCRFRRWKIYVIVDTSPVRSVNTVYEYDPPPINGACGPTRAAH